MDIMRLKEETNQYPKRFRSAQMQVTTPKNLEDHSSHKKRKKRQNPKRREKSQGSTDQLNQFRKSSCFKS